MGRALEGCAEVVVSLSILKQRTEIVEEEMEKLDELTDLAAIEMVAEEALDEIMDENLEFDIIAEADDSENEIIEGSGLSQLDFGSITEVTK